MTRSTFHGLNKSQIRQLKVMIFEFSDKYGQYTRTGLDCYNNESSDIQRLCKFEVNQTCKANYNRVFVKRIL